MPPLPPTRLLALSLPSSAHLSHPLTTTTTATIRPSPSTLTRRPLTTTPHPSSSSHQTHDPPTGWLFGVPPGQKYEKEGWEGMWVWGFWGSLILGAVGYAYKPDSSIQTWALEEARRRLEIEGILPDPDLEGEGEGGGVVKGGSA